MRRFILTALLWMVGFPAYANVPCSLPFTLTTGTLAQATEVMANFNAIITCLTTAAIAGGNNDITALNGLITPITPAQGGTNVFLGGISTGLANAQVVASTTPNTFTLTQGFSVAFIAGFTNTAATTFTIGGTAAKNVFRSTPAGTVALTGGEITAGMLVVATYDGTNFQLLNPANQVGGLGVQTAASVVAGTVDLGLVPNHFASVAAGVITSFGASANVNWPYYLVRFTGAVTITYNAVSLITPGTANISAVANDVAEVVYLGGGNWQVVNFVKANGAAIVNPTPMCGAQGLTLSTNGTNANIVYATDQAVLLTSANVPIYVTGVSGTINTSIGTVTSTADGMDGEATPTSVFGHVYLISNGTTTSGLVSTSATAPTLPAGYIYKCRMGAIKFSGASIPLVHHGFGANVDYFPTAGGNTTTFPILVSTGACCAGALTNMSGLPTPITSFVPTTATRVRLIMACTTNCTLALSSTAATNGSAFSATNPSECERQDTGVMTWTCDLPYNSGNVFFQAVNAGTWSIAVAGWRDKVNAN